MVGESQDCMTYDKIRNKVVGKAGEKMCPPGNYQICANLKDSAGRKIQSCFTIELSESVKIETIDVFAFETDTNAPIPKIVRISN